MYLKFLDIVGLEFDVNNIVFFFFKWKNFVVLNIVLKINCFVLNDCLWKYLCNFLYL